MRSREVRPLCHRSATKLYGVNKASAAELEQIKKLVASGVFLNTSDFVSNAVQDKLAAIKATK